MRQHERAARSLALIGTVAALGAVGVGASPLASAADSHAAIAWSPLEGVGGVGEAATSAEAIAEAIGRCKSNGGTSCGSEISAAGQCIALAVNGAVFRGGSGPTLDTARSDALAKAGGGTIKQSTCAAAQFNQAPAPQPPPPAPTGRDTDGDGLADRDEVTIHFTNPFLADTDFDGANDGDEVKNGTNPLLFLSN